MMNTFSPRDRLTLVVGAAIIVSLMSASIGVPRYRAWRTVALGAATRETELLAQVEGSVARFNGTSVLLAKARGELGVQEDTGPGSNPRVIEYLHSTTLEGGAASTDETPWCSAFVNWCVDANIITTAQPNTLFIHYLPTHHSKKIKTKIINGPQSVMWDKAENRLHTQKTLIKYLVLSRIG